MVHLSPWRLVWLAACFLLVCSVDAEVCTSGAFKGPDGLCVLCPVGSNAEAGSTSITSCKCSPGSSGGYTRPIIPGGAFTQTFHDVGWEQFATVSWDVFSSGVAVSTDNSSAIYFTPLAADFIGMYHPDSDTWSRINIDVIGMGLGQIFKYSDSVFAPINENIYFIPIVLNQVGVLNTKTNVFSVISHNLGFRRQKYRGGVLSQDGSKIYMIPYDEPRIGVVDVNTHVITTISISSTGLGKYAGGVLAGNGKIYLVPAMELRSIGVLDPTAGNTFSEIDISSFLIPIGWDVYTFSSAVLGENGMIYFMPRDGNIIGLLDPTTHTFSVLMDISASFTGGQVTYNKYKQGIIVGSDKIYMVPGSADQIGLLTLSSSGNTFEHLGAWVPSARQPVKYDGGVLLNGKIYMVPKRRAAIDVVDLNMEGCTACAVDTYSAVYGASACSTCPTHSSSPLNALTLDRCVCDVGYNGGDSGTCTPIVPGEAGVVIQNGNPNLIPSALYGCNAGYYFMAGYCVACPAGTYNYKKTRAGIQSCTLCRHGKFTPDQGVATENGCRSCASGKFHQFRGQIDDSKCKQCSCV